MEKLSREQYVYLAKLAEKAERYEDMAEFMRRVSESSELTKEERGLLTSSLKKVVGSLRVAWRIVSSIETIHKKEDDVEKVSDLNSQYKAHLQAQLSSACRDVLALVEKHLKYSDSDSESKVFFLKLKGDYHRYLAEVSSSDDRTTSAQETLASYLAAQELAEAKLPTKDPLRLGLALNFSVFYYEILKQHDKARSLATQAFNEAIDELDTEGDSDKNSILIMQLLRDNLSSWKA